MMNTSLSHIPERPTQPREQGVTMVMDKGLSLREAEDLMSAGSEYIDIIKFGFGTSLITKQLREKIKVYKDAGMKVYPGGTFFELFIVRDAFDDYRRFLDDFGFDACEVSDGSIILQHDQKCKYVSQLAKDRIVLSEVGSKDAGILISPNRWISMMKTELEAGSWKVIAEGRESGNVGVFRPNGKPHTMLINKILSNVKKESILWEAPQKSQQVWFIKLLGANVCLGNIAPVDVIPLESLRLGLRGDTFFSFLPKGLQSYKPEAE